MASTKKTWASAVRRPIAIGAGALALIGGAVMMPATASAATTAPTTTPAPTSTQLATTPSVPTPVIHLGDVCLTSDGTGVKPYDLSFTWDGQKGKTYGVTFSFNKVEADGSLDKTAFNGGFADGQTDSLSVPSSVATHGLQAGDYAVSVYLTDFSNVTSTTSGAVGGYEGEVHGATVTKRFAVTNCAPAVVKASQTKLALGAATTVSVSGAQPGEELKFALHSTVVQLGTVKADSKGDASLTFTIPKGLEPGAHTVTVDGPTTHLTQPLTVAGTVAAPVDTQADPQAGTHAVVDGTHRVPTAVQTDGDPLPLDALAGGALLLALISACGAGILWRRARSPRRAV